MPYGHASMLLLGEGSEAAEPYNKYVKIRLHSIRSLQFDQKVRPLSFRPEKFDLFTATPSDHQCGLCSRNCERRSCVRRNLLHIVFSKPIIAALFYWSTVLVAGMSSLLVVFKATSEARGLIVSVYFCFAKT